jgi:ankyrin repeat protein
VDLAIRVLQQNFDIRCISRNIWSWPILREISLFDFGQITLSTSRYCWHYYLGDSTFPRVQVYKNVCALHMAAYYGLETLTRALLANPSVDVNAYLRPELTSPLLLAVNSMHYKNSNTIRILLERKDIKVNLQNGSGHYFGKEEDGNTALMNAVVRDRTDVVHLLLKHREIDINVQNKVGHTALMVALSGGHKDIAHLFLARTEIHINLRDPNGYTALTWAMYHDYEGTARLILERDDVDITVRDSCYNTAIELAAHRRRKDVALLILDQHQIDINRKVKHGKTALMFVATFLDKDVVRRIFDLSDIDINAQDNDGHTALICAIKDGNPVQVEIVRLLGKT